MKAFCLLKRRVWMIPILLFCFALSGIAQTIKITGRVIDTNGEPLAGVLVKMDGTSAATTTDADGRYSINASNQDAVSLMFSYVGCVPQTVKLSKGQRVCDVQMQDATSALGEVVVVGYGVQKKANLTGAVSSVNMNDIEDIPVSNTASLLQGRMSGVTVSSFSAQPGNDDDVEIRIRGIGTFGDSNPLILIDGVEGTLSQIPASDIESISVLKDAASAAIYGLRAANGVILVTTKSGESGKKRISYSGSFGIQKATVLPKFISSWQWATLFNEENTALGEEAMARNYTPEMIEKLKNGSDPQYFANTNWMDEAFRTAFMQNHHLSMSGGGENSNYMASIGYMSQDGIMKGTSTKRGNFRLNANTKYFNMLTIGLNTAGSYQTSTEPLSGVWEIFNQIVDHDRPTVPLKYDNGHWGQYDGNPYYTLYQKNPIEETTRTANYKNWKFDGKVYVDLEPIKNLHIRSSFAYQYWNTNYHAFSPNHQHYKADGTYTTTGIVGLTEKTVLNQQWINENIVSYSFDILQNNHFAVLLGQSNQYNGNKYNEMIGENMISNEVEVLDAAQTTSSKGRAENATLRSFFGRINYDFAGRYLFEFNLRRDETSRLPKKNRVGYFPSVSAGWNIANEPFMDSVHSKINTLKLRASWGKLGNQDIGFYPYAQTYTIGQTNYVWGTSKVLGAALDTAANPDIKWETTTTTDIGLDIALFNNRFNLTFDYFNKNTSDILLQLPISSLIGVSEAPYVNAAEVRNRGWELSLGYNERFGEVNFSASFNISRIDNKIMSVSGREDWVDGWTINLAGNPIGAYYGYVAEGLYRSEEEIEKTPVSFGSPRVGDLRYADIDGDGEITDKDRKVIGNPFPKITYGLNLSAQYKGFDLTAFLQGVGSVDRIMMESPSIGGGVTERVLDRYNEKENPNGNFPALGNRSYNTLPSSFWIANGAYCRMKNLELGYTIPSKLLSKAKIQLLRFYISAQNLFTITNFKNYDPEKYARDSQNCTYPNAKTFSLGINLNF